MEDFSSVSTASWRRTGSISRRWRRGSQLAGFHESDRWAFLSGVQKLYLHQLDELGLWDLQTARLFAIEHHECRTDKDIVLLATTDMNLALRRMLDQVADRVTAVVHAPASHADRFDGHGCLIPEAWQEARIDLDADQIRIVDGPAEQADAVLECLASFDGRHRADEVVIGVPDEQLVPQLLRRFAQADLPARWMVGRTVQDTAPYRLLQALANQIDRGRFTDFASLGATRTSSVGSCRRGSTAIGSRGWTPITATICRLGWASGWAAPSRRPCSGKRSRHCSRS